MRRLKPCQEKSTPHNFKAIYSVLPCYVTCRKLVFLCSVSFLLKTVEMKGKAQRVSSAQHYKDISEKCHSCRHDEPSLKCFFLFVSPTLSLSLFFPWTSPRNVDLPSMQAKGAAGKTVATQDSGPDQKAICKARKAKKKSSTSNSVR